MVRPTPPSLRVVEGPFGNALQQPERRRDVDRERTRTGTPSTRCARWAVLEGITTARLFPILRTGSDDLDLFHVLHHRKTSF